MEIKLLRQPYKFIKKAKAPLKVRIAKELTRIGEDPKVGKKLAGKLKEVRSHKFTDAGIHYRIAYQIRDNILVVLIATRENFYKDLK